MGGSCAVMVEDAANMARLEDFRSFLGHCPKKRTVILIMGEEGEGSGEILEVLKEAGERSARLSLYCHLSELEESGIIEMAGY